MKFKVITDGIKTAFYRTKFWTKKHSPELLIAGGIVAAGASVVLAAIATKKLEKVTEPATKKIVSLHNDISNGDIEKKEGKKELVKVYAKEAWNLTKLYAPSVILFGTSVACILSSHKIQKGRELAMASAYATVDAAYKAYRERVKAKIGEQAEFDIFHNVHDEEVEVEETDKKGNVKTVKKTVKVMNDNPNDFTYLFDESNPNWEPDAGVNFEWILAQERWLNQQLRIKGWLSLDEVYKALGIEPGIIGPEKMKAARYLGWLYIPDDRSRDNMVSFGLVDPSTGNLTPEAMRMKRFDERNIYLTFNVDGDILRGDSRGLTFADTAKSW